MLLVFVIMCFNLYFLIWRLLSWCCCCSFCYYYLLWCCWSFLICFDYMLMLVLCRSGVCWFLVFLSLSFGWDMIVFVLVMICWDWVVCVGRCNLCMFGGGGGGWILVSCICWGWWFCVLWILWVLVWSDLRWWIGLREFLGSWLVLGGGLFVFCRRECVFVFLVWGFCFFWRCGILFSFCFFVRVRKEC